MAYVDKLCWIGVSSVYRHKSHEEGLVNAIGWALGPSIGWLAEGDLAITEEFDSVQLIWNLFEHDVANHFLETIAETDSSTSLIPRVPHSSARPFDIG